MHFFCKFSSLGSLVPESQGCFLGKENALQTYAAACAKLAMQEADREQDKLDIAARAHPVHTQAAYLHFLRAEREAK